MHGTIATDQLRGPRRLAYARNQLAKILDLCKPNLVVYEDYAMSRGAAGRVFHLGELGGVFKLLVWERGIDMMIVGPVVMKMLITGSGSAGRGAKGKAKKEPIARALRETFGITATQNDEADAIGLMLIGEMKTGKTPIPQTALKFKHASALATCDVSPGQLKSIAKG